MLDLNTAKSAVNRSLAGSEFQVRAPETAEKLKEAKIQTPSIRFVVDLLYIEFTANPQHRES